MESEKYKKAIGLVERELFNKCARIKVLALEEGSSYNTNENEIDAFCAPKGMAFGPSFFYKYPNISKGDIILFKLAPNPETSLEGDKDQMIVDDDYKPTTSFGYMVIRTDGQELVDDMYFDRENLDLTLLPEDKGFYLFSTKGLIGPFKLNQGKVIPLKGKEVRLWKKFRLEEDFISHNDKEILLKEPEEDSTWIDCMDNQQLNNWFRGQLKKIDIDLVNELDKKGKWRRQLDDIASSQDDSKKLFKARSKRFLKQIDDFEIKKHELIALVQKSEVFQKIFEDSIQKLKEDFAQEVKEP